MGFGHVPVIRIELHQKHFIIMYTNEICEKYILYQQFGRNHV